jgi:hypothetical protein
VLRWTNYVDIFAEVQAAVLLQQCYSFDIPTNSWDLHFASRTPHFLPAHFSISQQYSAIILE